MVRLTCVIVVTETAKHSGTSQEPLWNTVILCWDNMSHRLVESLPPGVSTVIKAKGGTNQKIRDSEIHWQFSKILLFCFPFSHWKQVQKEIYQLVVSDCRASLYIYWTVNIKNEIWFRILYLHLYDHYMYFYAIKYFLIMQ